MPSVFVLTICETARFFGSKRAVISGLMDAHNLIAKPVRHNGKAKGLDINDLCVIARSLGKPAPTLEEIKQVALVA